MARGKTNKFLLRLQKKLNNLLKAIIIFTAKKQEVIMNWAEISIFTTTEGIDAVSGSLMRLGITGFVIKDANDFEEFLNNKTGNWDYIDDDLMGLKNCETSITVYLPENEQGRNMFEDIKEELKALRQRDKENIFGRLDYQVSNVNEEDWANNWKKYFKPLKIGDKLLIKPSWESYDNIDNRIILEIDPASSFGTGQHNTTQLCLELLENHIKPQDRLLDLGCGSGILSIGAILLGAKNVTVVDIEENSVKTSIENAKRNNISTDIYTGYCGNIIEDGNLAEKLGSGYDIICANIVADVLIAMSRMFSSFLNKNGLLIMSGIISSRKDEVIDAVKNQGFEILDISEKEDWVAVMAKIN